MKKKLLFILLILTSRGSPLSGDIDTSNYIQDSLSPIAYNFSSLKYSISLSTLFSEQNNFKSEVLSFALNDERGSTKLPWLAFGLSLLYPGLGQLYNTEYGKALLMGGLGTIGSGLAILAAMSTDFDSESNPDYIGVMLYSGLAVYGGVYIWSMIDAPISASNINEQNKKLGIKIFSNDEDKFSIGFRSGNKIDNYSLDFLVSF
jgi:hypothetical protein